MCLLAINFPLGIRKITVTLQKSATITSHDAGCLISIFTAFFLDKSIYLVGGQGRAKFFN